MEFIIIGVSVAIGMEVWQWIKNEFKHPYKWKCSKCNLKISASDKAMIEVVKSTHTHDEQE